MLHLQELRQPATLLCQRLECLLSPGLMIIAWHLAIVRVQYAVSECGARKLMGGQHEALQGLMHQTRPM